MEQIDLLGNTDQAKAEIMDSLLNSGSATAEADTIRIGLPEWQNLVRAIAKELGRPVETAANEQESWAVLQDWPATPEEHARRDAMMHAALHTAHRS